MQDAHIGSGSLEHLAGAIEKLGARDAFLVTGRKSFEDCGAEAALARLLKPCRVRRFSDFRTNPDWADVERGIRRIQSDPCDVVIAVGGGSVLDMGKLINGLRDLPGDPLDYVRGVTRISEPRGPLIAIPTTAGSGSETTHFAVVYVIGEKHSLAHASLQPSLAIVDPLLTHSLPARITALGGIDALAQAVESYWSVRATDESKSLAREAMRAIVKHLKPAVHAPTPRDRDAMSWAACLAGKAIDITTTTACHALSYVMTARWGVPHGQAVAVTLPEMFVFNSRTTDEDVLDARGAQYVARTIAQLNSILGCRDATESSRFIRALVGSVGLETRLDALVVEDDDAIERIAKGVNTQRLANNPRRLTTGAIQELLKSIDASTIPKDPASRGPEPWKTRLCEA